jgi:hypothetical protein
MQSRTLKALDVVVRHSGIRAVERLQKAERLEQQNRDLAEASWRDLLFFGAVLGVVEEHAGYAEDDIDHVLITRNYIARRVPFNAWFVHHVDIALIGRLVAMRDVNAEVFVANPGNHSDVVMIVYWIAAENPRTHEGYTRVTTAADSVKTGS